METCCSGVCRTYSLEGGAKAPTEALIRFVGNSWCRSWWFDGGLSILYLSTLTAIVDRTVPGQW